MIKISVKRSRLMCFLGMHKWYRFTNSYPRVGKAKRRCLSCPKKQYLDSYFKWKYF